LLFYIEGTISKNKVEDFKKAFTVYNYLASNISDNCNNIQILINKILKSDNALIFFVEVNNLITLEKIYSAENILSISLIVLDKILANDELNSTVVKTLATIAQLSPCIVNLKKN
jgi:hypothetical protein